MRGLDAATWAKVWTPTPVAGTFSPIVADGSLYAQTSSALIAYRPTW